MNDKLVYSGESHGFYVGIVGLKTERAGHIDQLDKWSDFMRLLSSSIFTSPEVYALLVQQRPSVG